MVEPETVVVQSSCDNCRSYPVCLIWPDGDRLSAPLAQLGDDAGEAERQLWLEHELAIFVAAHCPVYEWAE